MDQRTQLSQESLSTAGLKLTAGGSLFWAWLESNQQMVMFVLGALFLLFQIIVILPKVAAVLKYWFFSIFSAFDRRSGGEG